MGVHYKCIHYRTYMHACTCSGNECEYRIVSKRMQLCAQRVYTKKKVQEHTTECTIFSCTVKTTKKLLALLQRTTSLLNIEEFYYNNIAKDLIIGNPSRGWGLKG